MPLSAKGSLHSPPPTASLAGWVQLLEGNPAQHETMRLAVPRPVRPQSDRPGTNAPNGLPISSIAQSLESRSAILRMAACARPVDRRPIELRLDDPNVHTAGEQLVERVRPTGVAQRSGARSDCRTAPRSRPCPRRGTRARLPHDRATSPRSWRPLRASASRGTGERIASGPIIGAARDGVDAGTCAEHAPHDVSSARDRPRRRCCRPVLLLWPTASAARVYPYRSAEPSGPPSSVIPSILALVVEEHVDELRLHASRGTCTCSSRWSTSGVLYVVVVDRCEGIDLGGRLRGARRRADRGRVLWRALRFDPVGGYVVQERGPVRFVRALSD